MSHRWKTHPERGSVLLMRLITWLALTLGRPVGRALLYPICAYFMVFSLGGRRASRQYLERVLGRPASLAEVFRHHYYFAATLLDRAFILGGQDEDFAVRSHGLEVMYRAIESGKGAILLGAHLGSFDLTRSLGEKRRGLIVNMMMFEENARKINQVIDSLGGKQRMRVIPIGSVDALIHAKERLDRGEMIGILGDRVLFDDKVVRAQFFGKEALFPAGPFLIASALRVPVIIFTCLYQGGNRYEEHFELLADEIVLDRKNRSADLQRWASLYAARLEHYCQLGPYNWFNFFDFWETVPPNKVPPAVQNPA